MTDWDLIGVRTPPLAQRRSLTTQGFASEIVTPPSALPVTVAEAQAYAQADSDDEIFARLIEAVTLETERSVLWRAIVRQRRRLVVDAPLARELTLEPVTTVVSLTRWTDANAAEVVPAEVYHVASSDPGGAGVSLRRGQVWPDAERESAAYALTYDCGWLANDVPAAIQHMILTAVAAQYQNIDPFAAAGVRDLKVPPDGSVRAKSGHPSRRCRCGVQGSAVPTPIGRRLEEDNCGAAKEEE